MKRLLASIILPLVFVSCTLAPRPLTITAPNGALFVDDGGRGALPILFVHGNGGSSEQWRSQLDYFRAHGHRAAAIDLPGFGKSAPASNGDYSLTAMSNAIERATEQLGLERFVIVGHSYGGAVVAQYAATHPEKVAAVIYVDSAASVPPLTAEQKTQFEAALRANRMQVVRAWFAPMLKPSSPAVSEKVFASVEESSIDAFVAALQSVTTWDPQQLINAYKGPRFAVVASDLENPFSFSNQFPDVRAIKIAGAGHWLMLDKPDELNAAIEELLKEVPRN
jgi:pimeloyl-ACP methyl ester carboxylesterase